MKLSNQSQDSLVEYGRVIAQGMQDIKVEQQKNMIKAERRRATMLENAAEKALSGKNSRI